MLTDQIMMLAIKMSIKKEKEAHVYKSRTSVHESAGNVKSLTATLITSDARGTEMAMMMDCIIIAYKPVTCLQCTIWIVIPQKLRPKRILIW